MCPNVSRRTVLAAGSLTASLLALSQVAAQAEPQGSLTKRWTSKKSQNGWPILSTGTWHRIEGTNVSVQLGEVSTATIILLHVARRYSYEIETLREDEVRGFVDSGTVQHDFESNYLSGTAIGLRPALYPTGVANLLYPRELVIVQDIIEEMADVVIWGGTMSVINESHFEIALPPNHPRINQVADYLMSEENTPSRSFAGRRNAFKS